MWSIRVREGTHRRTIACVSAEDAENHASLYASQKQKRTVTILFNGKFWMRGGHVSTDHIGHARKIEYPVVLVSAAAA